MLDLITYLLVLNVISGVNSLTVVSKRIQTQSPSLHRYKLSPLQQKVYRVPASLPYIQDRYRFPKQPKYRQKYRYHVKSFKPLARPLILSQKPRPPPLPLPKNHHDALTSNDVEELKDYEHETDFPHVTEGERFPSFGNESPYQQIKQPGEWITPTPPSEADLTFTPIQMYLQVRQTNQVKHVPQSEALKDAATLEEVVNAPRLKELLRTTRVREVYSEEGYEDTGYDHGGHIRHAEHDEGYAAQDEGVIKVKDKVKNEDYTVPEATYNAGRERGSIPVGELLNEASKIEPKISRSEFSSVELATLPSKYKGVNRYSSKVRSRHRDGTTEIAPNNLWAVPTTFKDLATTTRFDIYSYTPKETSEEMNARSKRIKIIPSEDGSRSSSQNLGKNSKRTENKGLKYNRPHVNYPNRERFRPTKLYPVATTSEPEEAILSTESEDKRIIVPTIGYINSLTTAHFGKNGTTHSGNINVLTTPLNLTQALNFLRSNKRNSETKKNTHNSHKKLVDEGVNLSYFFEPKRLRNRNRRGLGDGEDDDGEEEEEGEDNGEEEEEGEEEEHDDGEDIHDSKDVEIAQEEKERIESKGEDKEEYEKNLKEELDREEEEIVKASLGRHGSNEEISELFKEVSIGTGNSAAETAEEPIIYVTTVKPVDTSKYPFYFSEEVHEDSPLRYATDPKTFPQKKGKKMVFYESREKLVQCPEVAPDLADIPKRNSTLEAENDNNSRLVGLGDKIACLRTKYFDEDPLDNPLFKEKEINYVGKKKTDIRSSRNRSYPKIAANYRDRNIITKGRKPDDLRYHSSYQYKPNRTLHIMLEGDPPVPTKSNSERIIPVTEEIYESPERDRKSSDLASPPFYQKQIIPTPNVPFRSKIIIPHNCMQVIGKMAALDGHKNLIIHCNDAMLIQEMQNGVRYLKILPKISQTTKKQHIRRKYVPQVESTNWLPMVKYHERKHGSRFARKIELNDTDHYLITDLREHKGVRQGEVVEDWTDLEVRKRSKRALENYDEENESEDFPLRLSLKEFFLLLQGTNHRNRWSPKPFELSVQKPFQSERTQKAFQPPAPKQFQPPTQKSFQPPTPKPFQPPTPKPFQPPTPKPFQPLTQKPFQPPTPKPFQPPTLKPFLPQAHKLTFQKPFEPPTQKPFHLPTTSSTFRITTTLKPEDSQEDEVVKIGGQYIKGTNGREFVYVKYGPLGVGKWIASDVPQDSQERAKYTKKPVTKFYKKYGKGKL